MNKYIVYYTTGDFAGSSEMHEVIDAPTPERALEMVLAMLDAWLNNGSKGFAPWYGNVNVYLATPCLAKYKGKDKNGAFS